MKATVSKRWLTLGPSAVVILTLAALAWRLSVDARPVRSEEVAAALEEETVEAIAERARREGVPFVARLDRETRAREREQIELAVDTRRMHFFDPERGVAIYDSVPS